MRDLLHAVLHEAADRCPEAVAVVDGDRELTYAQLDRATSRIANMTRKHPNTERFGGPGASEENAKTGTSSKYVDGWYMGITRDLVTGVWVGCDDRSVHFTSSETGEGSHTALPNYARFMEKVYGLKVEKWKRNKKGSSCEKLFGFHYMSFL